MNQRDFRTPISPTDNLRHRGLQTVPLVVACFPGACEGEGLLKTLGQGKDLRFWVAEVSDCKLGLGAVPGPQQRTCSAGSQGTYQTRPWGGALKLLSHS